MSKEKMSIPAGIQKLLSCFKCSTPDVCEDNSTRYALFYSSLLAAYFIVGSIVFNRLGKLLYCTVLYITISITIEVVIIYHTQPTHSFTCLSILLLTVLYCTVLYRTDMVTF